MKRIKPILALMVEDNIDHAELMMDTFHEFDHNNEVNHVVNGEEAIKYLRNEFPYDDRVKFTRPDIIFLDIRMPRQSGIETLSLIKQDKTLQQIPVIMVSTSDTSAEIEQCYSLGANGYITKPLKLEQLSQKIKELHEGGKRTKE